MGDEILFLVELTVHLGVDDIQIIQIKTSGATCIDGT